MSEVHLLSGVRVKYLKFLDRSNNTFKVKDYNMFVNHRKSSYKMKSFSFTFINFRSLWNTIQILFFRWNNMLLIWLHSTIVLVFHQSFLWWFLLMIWPFSSSLFSQTKISLFRLLFLRRLTIYLLLDDRGYLCIASCALSFNLGLHLFIY